MQNFNEEIKKRIQYEEEAFEKSFYELSSVVMGTDSVFKRLTASQKSKNAIEEILRYYGYSAIELPEDITDFNKQLYYLLNSVGIMKRHIKLPKGWWKDATMVMMAITKEGNPVALIPGKHKGYTYKDYQTGKKVKVNQKNNTFFSEECYCFYKPFPSKSLSVKNLIQYMVETLSLSDLIFMIVVTLIGSLIGLIMPYFNQGIFSYTIPYGLAENLFPIFLMIVGIAFSRMLINISKALILGKIQLKMKVFVESASMQRILALPATFFKEYSSGDLSYRMSSLNSLSDILVNTILVSGLSALFSVVYFFQISGIAPSLLLPTLIIIGSSLFLTIFSTFVQLNLTRKKMAVNSKISGLVYSLFSGIQKIKLAGAERRAFSKWSHLYKESADYTYNPPPMIKLLPVISAAIPMIGGLLLYSAAGKHGVTGAEYMAFNVSYGMLSATVMSMAGLVTNLVSIQPTLEIIQPILKTVPEIGLGKQQISEVFGKIEINNITFRYRENTPLILDHISLNIEAGQYIGIVGKTGCGKSTLLRLLLGFEKPQIGGIYYDGCNIDNLDLKSLRSHIGVVTQDGKLFSGDVYSNIIISAPHLNIDEAWEAAEMAGFDKDIEAMPMGMHTVIGEGDSSISGGQKQRLMIARALASKPSVIMMDEATSALDNITQRIVSDSVNRLKTTRIVIAHRISTIKTCDRILMLEKGKIVEDGSFDELIAKNGAFTKLFERQIL